MANDALMTYLNDHLAGSATALELIDHIIETSDPAADKDFLRRLRADIADDRDTLDELARRVGSRPSAIRQFGGWVAEKAGRLKLILDDPPGGRLKRLESFELLALGIHGKRALWGALAAVAPMVPELANVDFLRLESRADEQHALVEARRLETARAALIEHL
jgi:hypothetical protein